MSETPEEIRWHHILMRAWSMRFLALSMLAFGMDYAFPTLAAWWPWAPQLLSAIGFATGGLVAVSRVIPQQNLPGQT